MKNFYLFKKFYAFGVALLAGCAVFANVPQTSVGAVNASPQFLTATAKALPSEAAMALRELGINPDRFVVAKDLPNVDKLSQDIESQKSMRKVSPKSFDLTSWQSLGEGSRMVCPLISPFGAATEVLDVDMYVASDEDENSMYAVVNPLKNSAYASSSILSISDDDAITMTTLYDEQVSIPLCKVYSFAGQYASWGDVYLFNTSWYYENYVGASSVTDSMYGTYKRGVITFAAGTTYLYVNGSYLSLSDDMTFAIPGKKLYYTSVEVENACVDDNGEVTATIYFGGDVSSVKVGLSPGYLEPSTSTYTYIASLTGADVITKSGSQLQYKLSGYSLGEGLDIDEHCPFTIIAAGVDASGSLGSGSMAQAYYQPEETKWKSIGTAKFTDGIVSDFFESTTLYQADVEMEESTELAGFYRLVNPYLTLFPKYIESTEHNHYLYLSAVEGEPIYIPYSSTGVDVGDGVIIVCSESYYSYYMGDGASDDINGVWDKDTNTITFNAYTLLIGESGYANGALTTANYDGTFAVQFPEGYNNVSSIVADSESAAAEYFNLQGMRIATPQAGEFVIRRQGNEVTKMVVK